MAENRRFYWMKLPNDYFRQLFQRKMRKQSSGIEMQVIYLKMLLYSIDKDAVIHSGVYESIEEELAEELGEESEMVKETIDFLEANQRLERTENGIFLPEALERVGSRRHRRSVCVI
ncbi:MAG: phage replisome organizer N-terminal domain-containing protein [Lachnospiraceae bacterium]